MTLDEAIKHAEEVAEENQRVVDTGIVFGDVTIDMLYCDDTEVIEEHLANYQRCAQERRQLAAWLKELKQLRESSKWISVNEKLPNLDDYTGSRMWQKKVLITGYLSFDDTKDLFVSEAFAEDVIHNSILNTVVVAWKPLPKPYKGKSEG